MTTMAKAPELLSPGAPPRSKQTHTRCQLLTAPPQSRATSCASPGLTLCYPYLASVLQCVDLPLFHPYVAPVLPYAIPVVYAHATPDPPLCYL